MKNLQNAAEQPIMLPPEDEFTTAIFPLPEELQPVAERQIAVTEWMAWTMAELKSQVTLM
jgi:hypothetical protein